MHKFKDRKDAKRCNDIFGMNQIMIDLKPKRSLGEIYINQKMDVTNLVDYINTLKVNDEKLTYFHAFSTLIGKVMYNRHLLNRFVANRHVYEHNDVTLSFVMKENLNDKSQSIMVLIPVEPNDNIFTISTKIRNKVNSIRNNQNIKLGANNAIESLGKLPNIFRIPIIGLFKMFDRHGWLPSSFIKDNIYYSSMIISNLCSLKCNGIYHNLTDFGTCSGLITIGEIQKETIKEKNKTIDKYFCEFGITFDERVADGFYFIKSLHLMQYILNNPEILEHAAKEKVMFE